MNNMQANATVINPMQPQTMVVLPPVSRVNGNNVRILAITQIIIGILTMILGVAVLLALNKLYWLTDSAGGIWGGLWILVTGIIGIASSSNLTNSGLNGTYMAFNIISTVIAFIDGNLFIVGVSYYSNCITSYYYRDYICQTYDATGKGLYIPLLLMMIVEFFVSIVAAVYCCQNARCCCGGYSQQTEDVIIMQQQPQFQMVQMQYYNYPQQGQVQQFQAAQYTGQMIPQPIGGRTYVATQGQPMAAPTNYVTTQAPINMVYSSQPPMNNMAPPPYPNKDAPPLETKS